ncbi:MAG: hypothetical protein ACFFD2_10185 [Promethearchaeota archaeon]
MDGPNWIISIHSQQFLRMNITSYEPYMNLTLNYTRAGDIFEFTISPLSSIQINWYIILEEEGDINYQVNLEYYGVVFWTDMITVTGVPKFS